MAGRGRLVARSGVGLALVLWAALVAGVDPVAGSRRPESARPDTSAARAEGASWSASYRAARADESIGTHLVVAGFRKALPARTTRIHVQNPGPDAADVTLTFHRSVDGQVIAGCDAACTARLEPGTVRVWDVATLDAVANQMAGWVVVDSDVDVAAVAEDVAIASTGFDSTMIEGVAPAAGETRTELPYVLKNDTGSTSGAGNTTLTAYNLDAALPAVVSGTLRPVGGGGVLDLPPRTVPATGAGTWDVANLATVPTGGYGASLTADRGVFGTARTAWTGSGAAGLERGGRVGTDIVVPLVFRKAGGRCSVLAIQNTAQTAVSAQLELQSLAPAAPLSPAVAFALPLPAAATVRLDVCGDARLAAAPQEFIGSMRLRVPGPAGIAVHAVVDLRQGRGVSIVAGEPAAEAATRRLAPVVHADYPVNASETRGMRLDTLIGAMNPSPSPISVTLTVRGADGPCAGQTYVVAPRELPAGRATSFDLGPDGGTGVPAGCRAAAVLDATGSGVAAVVYDEAYALPPPTPSPTATPRCVAPPSDMVAWWPFDETEGVSARDIGPFGNTATLHGGATWMATGKVRGALSLDGNTGYVDVPDSDMLDFGAMEFGETFGDFSVDFWTRVPLLGHQTGVKILLIKREEFAARGYSIFLFDDRLALQIADGNSSQYNSTFVLPQDDVWHHVTVTVDRDQADGIRFYFDGAEVGVRGNPQARPGSLANTGLLRLGAGLGERPDFIFAGALDELEIFNRVLSRGEVSAQHKADFAGKCTPTPGPTGVASPSPVRTATETPTETPTITPTSSFRPPPTHTLGPTPTPSLTPVPPTLGNPGTPPGTAPPTIVPVTPSSTPISTGCVLPRPGMLAWWAFDAGAGLPVWDLTVNHNHGVLVGAQGWLPAGQGRVAGALAFDGRSTHVDVADAPSLAFGPSTGGGAGDFAVATWLRLPPGASTAGARTILDTRSPGNARAGMRLHLRDGQIALELSDGQTSVFESTVAVPADGAWHHVAVSVDRDAVEGVRFYFDGALVGVRGDARPRSGSIGGGPLRLGAATGAVATDFLDGALDELQLYGRVLVADEVAAAVDAGSEGTCKTPAVACAVEVALDGTPPPPMVDRLVDAVLGRIGQVPLVEAVRELALLRQLRDEVLFADAAGRECVRTFDRFSPEIAGMLRADAALRAKARAVILGTLPIVEPLLGPAPGAARLTQAQVDAIDEVLASIEARGSPELAAEVARWRARIRGWVGRSGNEIWAEMRADTRIYLPSAAKG